MRASILLAGVACVTFGVGFASLPVRGDEAPTKVDTKGLPQLGDKWEDKNPFAKDGKSADKNADAIEVGANAYNQNCARCHGLEMISGGIAPDLRHVPLAQEGDDIFKERMQKGATRNGVMMMPVFGGLLPQETLWAVRTFMVSKHIDD